MVRLSSFVKDSMALKGRKMHVHMGISPLEEIGPAGDRISFS